MEQPKPGTKQTVVEEGTQFKGSLTSTCPVLVNGRVEGDGVVVAVVDSGANLDLPDLEGQAWTNTGEVCGNGADDDLNGYVDDCHGWNTASDNNVLWTPTANSHGTSVASIIAAHRDTHFSFLRDVKIGDVVDVTRDDGLTFTYRITNTRVAEFNQSGIERHAAGHHLVLSTCWPFDALTHGTARYIVEAEMVQ